MSKEEKAAADLLLQQAQNNALSEQVLSLTAQVQNLSAQNTELLMKVNEFEERLNTNSVAFDETAAPMVERPQFKIKGVLWQFRFGRFVLDEAKMLASDAAKDERLLARIVAEFPGLVERVTE